MFVAAAFLLLHAAPMQDTTPAAASPAAIATAYRNPEARELVRRAREYRHLTDRSLRGYQTLARQRMSAGLRTAFRDRQLFGSELAARVDWRRDGPVRVDIVGARQRTVVMDDDDGDDDDPRDNARSLAFDPTDDRMRMGLLGNSWIRHPLAEGSERDYRFTAGDTLTVRLSGGETVRVYELRLEPRRLGPPLVSGSIWLEDRSYGVVRTLLRLSQSLTEEIRSSSGRDSTGRRRTSVNVSISGDSAEERETRRRGGRGLSMLPDIRIDIRYITTEYGLVQGRWWMPTHTAVDATMSAGSMLAIPARFERSYSQYRVEGDPLPAPGAVAAAPEPEVADTPQACRSGEDCLCARGRCRTVEVTMPADTTLLASSPELPPPLTTGAPLLSGREASELGHELGKVASDPWLFYPRPQIRRAPVLLRFNRVEALSVGARQTVDFGPFAVDGTLRIATSNWEPDAEIGIRRETAERRLRLAGYRRLTAANPSERPLGMGNSLGALLWGRDNGDYFRATGLELRGAPPRAERPWLEWRLFGEHQSPVAVETDVSLRSIGSDFAFRPNIVADRADQAGLAVVLRPMVGSRMLGMSWGAEIHGEGQTGDFQFVRPSLTLRGMLPMGSFAAALEGAAGTSFGDVPVQSLWRLGGAGTLRGYDGSSAAGTAFWRARGELARGSGAARFAVFSDLGWAGDRDDFSGQAPLWSAGAGVSVLDGVVRIDLARALRSPTGWRLEIYMDGAL